MAADLMVTPELSIPASELVWSAVRSSGPGGQNVNRVSTKVELAFDFRASAALTETVKTRLSRLAAGRLDAEGRILITSQVTRSQTQNLEDARAKLAALIRSALVVPKRRRPTRPTRGSRERRLESKRHTSEKKRLRRSSD